MIKKRTTNVHPWCIERTVTTSAIGSFVLEFTGDTTKVRLHLGMWDIEHLASLLHEQVAYMQAQVDSSRNALRGE